jgi:hypothetical protein
MRERSKTSPGTSRVESPLNRRIERLVAPINPKENFVMTTPRNGATTIGAILNQSNQPQPAFDPNTQPTHPGPADSNATPFVRNFGKFEREGATYSWKIFRPGREKLVGHSKPKDQAEKPNKQDLLMDCVKRLAKNGYLKEGMRIEFYRNFSDYDKDSSMVFTLYPNRFIPERIVVTELWLMKFLKDLYSPVVYSYPSDLFPTCGRDTPPEGVAVIPDSSKQAPPKDPFDLSRQFKSEDALHNYIEKLMREGQPKDRVQDYYGKMITYFHPRR